MKTRPILFSGPMVRALLAGTKTQTRRIVKGVDNCTAWSGPVTAHDGSYPEGPAWYFGRGEIKGDPHNFYVDASVPCPYGVPGDRLWVRETWRVNAALDDRAPAWFAPSEHMNPAFVRYEADGAHTVTTSWTDGVWGKTRVSIHMPRWASRLTLEITDVRVERLQAISEADAEAEGIERNVRQDGWDREDGWVDPTSHEEDFPAESAQAAYRALWESINGAGSWDANPWVWALTFKRVDS